MCQIAAPCVRCACFLALVSVRNWCAVHIAVCHLHVGERWYYMHLAGRLPSLGSTQAPCKASMVNFSHHPLSSFASSGFDCSTWNRHTWSWDHGQLRGCTFTTVVLSHLLYLVQLVDQQCLHRGATPSHTPTVRHIHSRRLRCSSS